MIRRVSDPFLALIAGILLVMGQSFLLIPQHQGELMAGFAPPVIIIAGLLFHFTGMAALGHLVIPFSAWKSRLIDLLAAIGMAVLASLYASAGRMVETILFTGLTIMIPLSIYLDGNGRAPERNLLPAFATFLNLASGLGLLGGSALLNAAAYQEMLPYRPAFCAAFLVSGAIGGFILFHPQARAESFSTKLLAIPWLGWCLIFALTKNMPGLLPAVFLSLTLLTNEFIPWHRLKLPPNDLLGRRVITLTATFQTVFLIAVVFLLGSAETTRTSSLSGWDILHLRNRELAFLLILGTEALLTYGIVTLVIILNGLASRLAGGHLIATESASDPDEITTWNARIERLVSPLTSSMPDLQKRVDLLSRQIATLNAQLAGEKRRAAQLTLLSELSQQLENQLDAPVAAQLAVNTLQRSLNCTLAVLYVNEPERRELVALAAAGTRLSALPPGYRQSVNIGILGRAARQRKTQVINDTRNEPDFLRLDGEDTLSIVTVPLIDRGHLKALLEISDNRVNTFSSSDVQITEAVASEVLRAWERSEYHQRLTELIQAGISLTAQPDPQEAVQEVAAIARQTLRARFAFVTLLDQEGNFTRNAFAGHAPHLLKSIRRDPDNEPLMQAALNATHSFRVRDIRKYKRASHIEIDFPNLRSMIAIPIRMHRLSVGAMLAFGKQGEVFFSENDESLAELLSSQAAAAIESAWLSQELRNNLASTTQLYQLSFHIIQAQELTEAARYIAEAAWRICTANSTGILLLRPDQKVEAEVLLDENGVFVTPRHPMELVRRAMDSGQSIFISSENDKSSICFPLKTPKRTYGALWLTLSEGNGSRYATNLQTMANQAAVALERSILLAESRQQAQELETAYRELETTYDHTLAALISALDARDRETEGHSLRVSKIARAMGEELNLSALQLKALERGSLLHDIGKIGISDTILHKPGPLDPNEWKIMRLHPDIGARIVEGISFLQDTLAVIRYHQERWDGSGYPVGLSGKDIPYLARIFAVADAFDALTSDRPYRNRIQTEDALQYLHEQAGILFDPQIVQILEKLVSLNALTEIDQK